MGIVMRHLYFIPIGQDHAVAEIPVMLNARKRIGRPKIHLQSVERCLKAGVAARGILCAGRKNAADGYEEDKKKCVEFVFSYPNVRPGWAERWVNSQLFLAP